MIHKLSTSTETLFILLKKKYRRGQIKEFFHGRKCASLQHGESHMMTFSTAYQRICNHYSQILGTRARTSITCDPLQLSESEYLLGGLHLFMILELTFSTSYLPETHLFFTTTKMPFLTITTMSLYKQ